MASSRDEADDVFSALPIGPLSIGLVLGGPRSPWRDVVADVGRRVIDVRDGVDFDLALNVVFHAPGRYLTPDFDGVRTATFSRKHRHLMVQAALPTELPPDPDAEVRRLLVDAVDAAEVWALRRRVAEVPLIGVRAVLGQL